MAKGKKDCRYTITDVQGSMVGRIAIGDVVVDYWKGQAYTWQIFDFSKGSVTGEFTGHYIGKSEQEAA